MRDALGRLADAGIPLGNQSVLLRNVNDDPAVMKAHVQKLLMCRVKPYYIYQCDLIAGSAHLRTSVRKGLQIMESLRGHTTGYAVPEYVIDAPGGGGKVPVTPEYVLSRNADRVVIRNYEGKIFEYPEAERWHAAGGGAAGDRRAGAGSSASRTSRPSVRPHGNCGADIPVRATSRSGCESTDLRGQMYAAGAARTLRRFWRGVVHGA